MEDFSFLRAHHSRLVNINEWEQYARGEGYLKMSDGSTVSVSGTRKELLLKKIVAGSS